MTDAGHAVGYRESTDLLIIGAGPFGLSLSAYAKKRGIDHVVLGEPMSFWRTNMPAGMFLRSNSDWHLDPFAEYTIEAYLRTIGVPVAEADPFPIDLYLGYCDWFRAQQDIRVVSAAVERLDFQQSSGAFSAQLSNGTHLQARNVVVAVGVGYFEHVPEELAALFPRESFRHTREFVECERGRGRRILIVGGRQSAFEWAALLKESGAEAIHVVYRHDTPAFALSDWSWVDAMVEGIAGDPGWFRRLSDGEKDEVSRRLWAEGRLKLEPWLAPRISGDNVKLYPRSQVAVARRNGELVEVELSDGTVVKADDVILATGYKVDVGRIPFIQSGSVYPRLATSNGFPLLSEGFESNLPGLFFTSACAAQDFGPFFGFTVAARVSAELVGKAVAARIGAVTASD